MCRSLPAGMLVPRDLQSTIGDISSGVLLLVVTLGLFAAPACHIAPAIQTAPGDELRMAFVTILPLQRNDGTPVPPAELQSILDELRDRFGGLTVEGEVDGHWEDPQTHRRYHDRGLEVLVAFPPDRLAEAREAVRSIGARLGQHAMYFELRERVEFLDSTGRSSGRSRGGAGPILAP